MFVQILKFITLCTVMLQYIPICVIDAVLTHSCLIIDFDRTDQTLSPLTNACDNDLQLVIYALMSLHRVR